MKDKLEKFKDGFFRGLGWSFGVTIGFTLISTLIILILRSLGGLPVVGTFFASLIDATSHALQTKF